MFYGRSVYNGMEFPEFWTGAVLYRCLYIVLFSDDRP